MTLKAEFVSGKSRRQNTTIVQDILQEISAASTGV